MTTTPATRTTKSDHTNGSWWIARYPTSFTCHKCGAITKDPPAIQRYVRELDHGGVYGPRFGDWTVKGWRVWRACSACRHECDGQTCEPITATDGQIALWTRRIGPWRLLNGSAPAAPRALPVLEEPPGWQRSASGGSIYQTADEMHISVFPKRSRDGQWYLKIEVPIDVDNEYEAAAKAEELVYGLGVRA